MVPRWCIGGIVRQEQVEHRFISKKVYDVNCIKCTLSIAHCRGQIQTRTSGTGPGRNAGHRCVIVLSTSAQGRCSMLAVSIATEAESRQEQMEEGPGAMQVYDC